MTQPETLRRLITAIEGGWNRDLGREVATELRRLHAANGDLQSHFDALKADYDRVWKQLNEICESGALYPWVRQVKPFSADWWRRRELIDCTYAVRSTTKG